MLRETLLGQVLLPFASTVVVMILHRLIVVDRVPCVQGAGGERSAMRVYSKQRFSWNARHHSGDGVPEVGALALAFTPKSCRQCGSRVGVERVFASQFREAAARRPRGASEGERHQGAHLASSGALEDG